MFKEEKKKKKKQQKKIKKQKKQKKMNEKYLKKKKKNNIDSFLPFIDYSFQTVNMDWMIIIDSIIAIFFICFLWIVVFCFYFAISQLISHFFLLFIIHP